MFRSLLVGGISLVLVALMSPSMMVVGLSSNPFSGVKESSPSLLSQLDVTSPTFDVDWGVTEEERGERLRAFASTPLKGWNSYDGWDWSVTEKDMLGNMMYMADHLLSFGYSIATVDYYWYMDMNGQTIYSDEFGRLQPDPNRFPSSVGNKGFTSLAAYAHSRGLLFGIHTMRGISQVAITQKLKVMGTNYTADEVYDANAPCPWSPVAEEDTARFYSLNMSHPGAQAFYNALYQQYASWGVDFIKNDCVYSNYVPEQIAAVSAAIDASGRQMLYSLSPGDDNNNWARNVSGEVSMYRVTGDTWDRWDNIKTHFLSAQHMQPFIAHPNGRYGLPSWPDLDMLPLGYLGIEGSNIRPLRLCNLTRDEQITLMSLWTIFRSPLIYGGDLQHPDNFSLALITNPEALNITDHSINTNFITSNVSTAVWRSDSEGWQGDGRSYFTVHNILDTTQAVTVTVAELRGVQKGSGCVLRDIWTRQDIRQITTPNLTFELRPHASGLYALHSCNNQSTAAQPTNTQHELLRRLRRATREVHA